MHESMDDQLGMPTGSPEALMTQPHTTSDSDSDLLTVPPILTDTSADETRTAPPILTDTSADEMRAAPAAPGVHDEGDPALATAEGSLLLRSADSAPSADELRIEEPAQSASGPAPKKRRVAAPATISDSISDKYGIFLYMMFF